MDIKEILNDWDYDADCCKGRVVRGKVYKVIPTWNPSKTIAVTCSRKEAEEIASAYKENETYIEEEEL